MTKSQTFTARTVEEAKALAGKTWGVPVSEITFEVVEEPKRGFLGVFGKGEAKVKATYTSPEKAAEPVPEMVQETIAHVVETVQETVMPVVEEIQKNVTPAVEDVQEAVSPMVENIQEMIAPAVENVQKVVVEPVEEAIQEEAIAPVVEDVQEASAPVVEEIAVPEETVAEAAEIIEEAVEEVEKVIETAVEEVIEEEASEAVEELAQSEQAVKVQDDEELISGEPSENSLQKIEKAKTYLSNILEKMGVKAELHVTAGAESALIEIVAPNSGAVIGKRGETLDALQYLTFMIANRGDKEYYRIILNSANYRERRRKTLEELAHKIAKGVLRSGRATTLEPMNPYERRIIHSAIAEIEGVNSKSIGEEPYRKVVISSNNAKPSRKRNNRRGHDGEGRGERRRTNRGRRDRDRRRDDNVQPERISMDSMKTSFEKDYKRPKAEDEINAGLYGKIEF